MEPSIQSKVSGIDLAEKYHTKLSAINHKK